MGISLFLDDRRDPPPGDDWVVARTSRAAIAILARGGVTLISLDHDLGGRDTGMNVVVWLEASAYLDPSFVVPAWRIHSANRSYSR